MTSRRPPFRFYQSLAPQRRKVLRRAVRTSPLLGLLAMLAACAGQPGTDGSPSIPVAEEAEQYRAHARSYYAPPGPPEDPWGPYIQEASKKFDVPEEWVRAVMQQESGGRLYHNGQFVTSAPGAMGLMQLMPPTYDALRYAYNLGDDAFDPHDNIMAGTAYIRQMYDVYGSPGFLAAYNAGPGRLEDFLTRNRTLPRETRNYVASIGRRIVGIWPANRSQADMLVASHDSMALAYQPVQSNTATSSVRTAWQRRQSGLPTESQPVQVAEAATESSTAATPSYGADWHPVSRATAPSSTRNDVSSVWAQRLANSGTATNSAAEAPVQVAQAVDASEPVEDAADEAQAAATPATVAPAQPHVLRIAAVTPAATPSRSRSFHLVSPAMAEPAPLLSKKARAQEPRNWAIQVGAFNTASMAQQATGQARNQATLSGAKAQVAAVQVKKGRLYRARLTNLSHTDAVAACRRLSGCVLVSPDSSRS
ncbi:transglycosylase SLT domain-containing protein [Acetobacter malorum]|uniref:transglycosylase SLT domain-containing protein n=1 Tax=Acetobacter malorum TaxID=178901 RepID=UPI00248F4102|nr:transglycosylase SLT domain-containing protein [Acetobacter malorum]